jgi:hypothetical protein
MPDSSKSSANGDRGGRTDAMASSTIHNQVRGSSGGVWRAGNVRDDTRVAAEPSPRAGPSSAGDVMQSLAPLGAVAQRLPEARFPGANIGVPFSTAAVTIPSKLLSS